MAARKTVTKKPEHERQQAPFYNLENITINNAAGGVGEHQANALAEVARAAAANANAIARIAEALKGADAVMHKGITIAAHPNT